MAIPQAVFPINSLIADRYEIREVIYKGAMSIIYRAWHTGMECQFALKVMLVPPGTSQQEAEKMFRREKKHLKALDRTGRFPRIFDHFWWQGQAITVLEFLEGETLEHKIKTNGAFRPRDAAHTIREILLAAQEMFRRQLIHRDIKPSNIIGCNDGRILLLDLGVALEVQPGTGIASRRGQIVAAQPYGTPGFFPPEAPDGHLSPMGDIYSIGIVLATLLTGKFPGAILPPEGWEKQDSRLVKIIRRATAPEPADRYQSPAEMLVDIDKYLKLPVRNSTASSFWSLRLSDGQPVLWGTRRWIGFIAALLGILGGSFVWSYLDIPTGMFWDQATWEISRDFNEIFWPLIVFWLIVFISYDAKPIRNPGWGRKLYQLIGISMLAITLLYSFDPFGCTFGPGHTAHITQWGIRSREFCPYGELLIGCEIPHNDDSFYYKPAASYTPYEKRVWLKQRREELRRQLIQQTNHPH